MTSLKLVCMWLTAIGELRHRLRPFLIGLRHFQIVLECLSLAVARTWRLLRAPTVPAANRSRP